MRAIGFYLLLFSVPVHSQPNPVHLLSSHLFKDYNSNVSPYANRRNSTSHVNVTIGLAQAVIDGISERDWTISVLTLMKMRWIDPRLRWDPSLFDEITEIAVKVSGVWQPDVFPCKSSSSSPVILDGNTNSAKVRNTGEVVFESFQKVSYSCAMVFDAFPFDVQNCQICYGLGGISGATVDLIDASPPNPDLLGNSEWHFVSNVSMQERRTELDGIQKDRINYTFSLARRPFFWVALIIVPTCLICIVALVGIFFAGEGKLVDNAVTIGLTTMTSLMLVVTILADSLAKADNLPGLGWFVLYDIGIVCIAAIVALIIDHSRSLAISSAKKKRKLSYYFTVLLSKRTYRFIRICLFILAILGLALNVALRWSSSNVVA